ncbi:MAG TPA: hypothetical protein EYH08_03240 [Pyrodictium sp.]|nr:hypothetical protein [Pyrodictium sp.]
MGRLMFKVNPVLVLVLLLAITNAIWYALYQQKQMEIRSIELKYEHLKQMFNKTILHLKELNENYTSLQLRYGRLKQAYDQLYKILEQGLKVAGLNNLTNNSSCSIVIARVGGIVEAYKMLNKSLSKFARIIWLHTSLGPQTQKLIDPDRVMSYVLSRVVGRLYDPNHPEWLDKDIEQIYVWVKDNIINSYDTYFPDIEIVYINISGELYPKEIRFTLHREYVQNPEETLERRAGDCEDQAILVTSMLQAYLQGLGKAYMVCVVSAEYDITHCASIAVVNGTIYILDTSMEYFGKDVNAYNAIMSWLAYIDYDPQYIDMIMVINDKFYQVFRSLNKFTTWLQNMLQQKG